MTPAYIAKKLVARLGRELAVAYVDARAKDVAPAAALHLQTFWSFVRLLVHSATEVQIARLRLQLITRHAAFLYRRDYVRGIRGAFSHSLACPSCERWEDVQDIEHHAELCHQLRQRAVADIDEYARVMRLQLKPIAA